MDQREALQTTTGLAKGTIADDDVGTLTSGDHADIVAFLEDFRDDISAVRKSIDAVYKSDEPINR